MGKRDKTPEQRAARAAYYKEYSQRPENNAVIVARAIKWQQDHKDHRKAYLKEYHRKHGSIARKRTAAWKKANPERVKVNAIHYQHKRRQWKGDAANDPMIKKLLSSERKKKKHLCYFCRREFVGAFHLDHVNPLSQGGRHDTANVAVACPKCNQSKSDAKLGEFSADNQRLLPV